MWSVEPQKPDSSPTELLLRAKSFSSSVLLEVRFGFSDRESLNVPCGTCGEKIRYSGENHGAGWMNCQHANVVFVMEKSAGAKHCIY
jgi:hypothetical protein